MASKIFLNHANSLVYFSNTIESFVFKSKIEGSEEKIQVHYDIVEFDEELSIVLYRLLESALDEARKLSTENMGREITKGSLNGIICSKINKFSYFTNDEFDLFDFVSELFISILMGHKLSNGNKRLSIVFLKVVLWHFGYYLKFTQGFQKDYTIHKTFIEEFVRNLENKEENDVEAYKATVKKWILENVIIGLNWR